MSSSSGASIGGQLPPPPAAPPDEEKKNLNSDLWHACAGPLVCLPTVGTRVVYFPQGHNEQVAASTNKEVEGYIPKYPKLPPQLICQLHDVTMHADVETDEVYAQMTLQLLNPQEQNDAYLPAEMGIMSKQPTNYFCNFLAISFNLCSSALYISELNNYEHYVSLQVIYPDATEWCVGCQCVPVRDAAPVSPLPATLPSSAISHPPQ